MGIQGTRGYKAVLLDTTATVAWHPHRIQRDMMESRYMHATPHASGVQWAAGGADCHKSLRHLLMPASHRNTHALFIACNTGVRLACACLRRMRPTTEAGAAACAVAGGNAEAKRNEQRGGGCIGAAASSAQRGRSSRAQRPHCTRSRRRASSPMRKASVMDSHGSTSTCSRAQRRYR